VGIQILAREQQYDRGWFQQQFERIFNGWYGALKATSPSCAVWETPRGIKTRNFLSKSGKQCDGVTRMMPALAAWAAQPENGADIPLPGGERVDPRKLLRDIFVNATDPAHPDFWQYSDPFHGDQRQVESSIVAWTLWLSRDWLLPLLSKTEVANIQSWLASCTEFSDHYNNWSLFTATNHAARIALSEYGFSGDVEAVRRDLIPGDDVALGDGWLWDKRYAGIDYYNFWVWGSHHCYLKAMLPQYNNLMLERALQRFSQRLPHMAYMFDARGQNILFGRSLAYRWGVLSGSMAADYIGISGIPAGLSRQMFARNLSAWLGNDSLNEDGVLHERLTSVGSEGAREGYINCGHPYWGIQAFLCLALPDDHAFWRSPLQPLPIDERDFQVPCQGPGLVFQGFRATGEVRMFNLRNLDHQPNTMYQKFVYSTGFPCNSDGPHHGTLWDNQFGLRLADGTQVNPAEIMEIDTFDGTVLHLVWRFKHAEFEATVHSTLRVEAEIYQSAHEINVRGNIPEGAHWIEGGFTLGHRAGDKLITALDANSEWAEQPGTERIVFTKKIAGWLDLRRYSSANPDEKSMAITPTEAEPNIIYGRALHYYLIAPVEVGRRHLVAQHGASLNSHRFKKLYGLE
jgi:hypothetical protein